MGSSMVGSSCCLSWGIAMAPKAIAMIDISPIRARWARLNLDSQDMKWVSVDVSGGTTAPVTDMHKGPRTPSAMRMAGFVAPGPVLGRRVLRAEYAPGGLTPPLGGPDPIRTR